MFGNSEEQTVTVEKSKLLDTLSENRKHHLEKVIRAREVYREKIVEELDKRLDEAKKGGDIDPGFLHRFPIPRDFTEEYDVALAMYEWELETTVVLTRTDFRRFILDQWEWNDQFRASTQAYGIR